MNTMKFENSFSYIPALLVSGSFVVSIFIAIAIIINIYRHIRNIDADNLDDMKY